MQKNAREAAISRLVELNYSEKTAPHIVDSILEVFSRYTPKEIASDVLCNGDLRLNPSMKQVFYHKKEITLTPRLYRILEYLVRNAGNVISLKTLAFQLWGAEFSLEFASNIRVSVAELRGRIDPDIIKTKSGEGYYIDLVV